MKLDKVEYISTKKGDKGQSKNYSNEAFDKDDVLFETLGTMDELSATLGMAYHHSACESIKVIQRHLQDINSLIATNKTVHPERYEALKPITEQDVAFLEDETQRYLDLKPLEPRFVLPGTDATKENAYFDLARVTARRAERQLVRYVKTHTREDLDVALMFMNRLSDLLFVLARNYPSA